MKKFPEQIYVYRDHEEADDEVLLVDRKPEDFAVPGECKVAGIYQLIGTAKITGVVNVLEVELPNAAGKIKRNR